MGYSVKWRQKALKSLRKLPKEISKRIVKRIDLVKENPKHFLEKLVDDPGFKVRTGDYRIIIDVIDEEEVIAVRLIGHRRNIYKRKL